jgi:hypothetical protein
MLSPIRAWPARYLELAGVFGEPHRWLLYRAPTN